MLFLNCPVQDGLLLGPGLQGSWLAEMGFGHLTMPRLLFSSSFFLPTSLFPLAKCLFGPACSTTHVRQHELAAPDLGKGRAAASEMPLHPGQGLECAWADGSQPLFMGVCGCVS